LVPFATRKSVATGGWKRVEARSIPRSAASWKPRLQASTSPVDASCEAGEAWLSDEDFDDRMMTRMHRGYNEWVVLFIVAMLLSEAS
jgi:hypothetical protein